MANITLLGADYPDVPAVQLPKTGGGTAMFYEIKTDQVTGTTSGSGNLSKVFTKKVKVLSAWSSTGGYIIQPYAGAGADGDGQYTWWFHVTSDGAQAPAVTSTNLTIYMTYIEG